ncbi:MAG: hypothetical protein D6B27_09340 [Gammaproteobacteria bacterium]|nr:MAG: hypothetical protein D6B27_09340 [Gammaproteobacteria bacterium]
MESITYNLILCDDEKNITEGVLTYSMQDSKSASATDEITKLAEKNTEVSTFEIKGEITLPEITGSTAVEVSGMSYVSMMGPPISSILISQKQGILSMQFNIIDSPGTHIGGGLSYAKEPMKPAKMWSVLGIV